MPPLNRPGSTETDDDKWFVFEPIANWASKTPSQIAIRSGEFAWTYEDLERHTNQIARYLIAQGVTRGDRVAFVLPRGPQALLLLISILKAGAAYVPLDSESPPNRIRECLEDASPKLILAFESHLIHALEGIGSVSVERLLDACLTLDSAPIPYNQVGLLPSDLAYIIFTSGSTGRPKGVPISHQSLSCR